MGREERDPFEEWIREIMRFIREVQKDMERQLEELMSMEDLEELEDRLPRFTAPSGIEFRAPFVYGYYMTIGPDGRPIIRRFGNVPPPKKGEGSGEIEEIETRRREGEGEEITREPVLDVMDFGDEIVVVAEIPGVRKEDIEVSATERRLTIRARPYSAEVSLPSEVEPEGARATYSNGILEVRLPKRGGGRAEVKERRVRVE